jgi:hypothetical protein
VWLLFHSILSALSTTIEQKGVEWEKLVKDNHDFPELTAFVRLATQSIAFIRNMAAEVSVNQHIIVYDILQI